MKTLKLRIKDKHAEPLNTLASSVNFVWNYVNDLSFKHLQCTGHFFSAYDIATYVKGSGELLNLHSQTLQAITETHAKSRKQFKKAKLNWRTNNPKAKRKSLGWIPFKKSAIKYLGVKKSGKKSLKSTLQFSLAKGKKLTIDVWDSYNLSLYTINTRQHLIHAFTSKLVKDNKVIVVGKLQSNSFTSTKLAKSVYDAGWFDIKRQLDYKCKHAGCHYLEVNESYTTQTCSCCGSRQNSPKGRANLGIREWRCECGVTHDRDVNAAKNILALGLERLAVGIPSV